MSLSVTLPNHYHDYCHGSKHSVIRRLAPTGVKTVGNKTVDSKACVVYDIMSLVSSFRRNYCDDKIMMVRLATATVGTRVIVLTTWWDRHRELLQVTPRGVCTAWVCR